MPDSDLGFNQPGGGAAAKYLQNLLNHGVNCGAGVTPEDQIAILEDCRFSRDEAEQLVTRGFCRKMIGLGEQTKSCDT